MSSKNILVGITIACILIMSLLAGASDLPQTSTTYALLVGILCIKVFILNQLLVTPPGAQPHPFSNRSPLMQRLVLCVIPLLYAGLCYLVVPYFPGYIVACAYLLLALGFTLPYALKKYGVSMYTGNVFGSLGFLLFGWCGTDWLLLSYIRNVVVLPADSLQYLLALAGTATVLWLIWDIYEKSASRQIS